MFTEQQKKILLWVLIVSLISSFMGIFLSSGISSFGTMLKIIGMAGPQKSLISNTNILIVGADSDAEKTHRADTIMVLNLNPYTKYIGLISVPRDSRMHVEGHGLTKINHAYAYGKEELLRKSLSNYLQIPIPYYIVMDMQGVSDLIDQLGGIPINVEKRMYYVDRAGDLYIDLYPGQQILDGNHAMQYIRFRGDYKADLGRIERQQNFIKAFANRILNKSIVFKAPTMIFKFSRYVRTNIPARNLINIAMRLKEAYQLGHLDVATVPSDPVVIDGVSYQQPNWTATQMMVQRVIKGYELYSGKLPDLRKPPELKVQILNGNGHARMGQNAKNKLKIFGYNVIDTRDAGRFDYKQSLIVNWHGEETEDEAFILARKLYISPNNIITYKYPQKPLNFSIVLGHDWPLER